MTSLRQRMLEDLRIRNYAPTTVECYVRSVAEFAQHFHQPPDQLGAEEIRAWQLYLLREKRVKLSTYIQARLVKIFKQRDCSIGAGPRDDLDSRCHGGERS